MCYWDFISMVLAIGEGGDGLWSMTGSFTRLRDYANVAVFSRLGGLSAPSHTRWLNAVFYHVVVFTTSQQCTSCHVPKRTQRRCTHCILETHND